MCAQTLICTEICKVLALTLFTSVSQHVPTSAFECVWVTVCSCPRCALLISYQGSLFAGWQVAISPWFKAALSGGNYSEGSWQNTSPLYFAAFLLCSHSRVCELSFPLSCADSLPKCLHPLSSKFSFFFPHLCLQHFPPFYRVIPLAAPFQWLFFLPSASSSSGPGVKKADCIINHTAWSN